MEQKKSKYMFDFLSSCLFEPPYKLKDCRSVWDKALYDSCSYIKFSLCSPKKNNNKATYHTSLVIVFFFQAPLHLIAFVPRSNTATLPQNIFKTLNDIILLNSLSAEIKSVLQVILPETPCWGPALS